MKAFEMGWILHDAWDIDSLAFRWVWRLASECGPRDSLAKAYSSMVCGWMRDRAMQKLPLPIMSIPFSWKGSRDCWDFYSKVTRSLERLKYTGALKE
jgi:hypothetical protein